MTTPRLVLPFGISDRPASCRAARRRPWLAVGGLAIAMVLLLNPAPGAARPTADALSTTPTAPQVGVPTRLQIRLLSGTNGPGTVTLTARAPSGAVSSVQLTPSGPPGHFTAAFAFRESGAWTLRIPGLTAGRTEGWQVEVLPAPRAGQAPNQPAGTGETAAIPPTEEPPSSFPTSQTPVSPGQPMTSPQSSEPSTAAAPASAPAPNLPVTGLTRTLVAVAGLAFVAGGAMVIVAAGRRLLLVNG